MRCTILSLRLRLREDELGESLQRVNAGRTSAKNEARALRLFVAAGRSKRRASSLRGSLPPAGAACAQGAKQTQAAHISSKLSRASLAC
eukprot:2000813-Pleurochrysis_carterae.AAC.1